MIVEFTGCSGAGKTSLVRRVRRTLREAERPVSEPFESFFSQRMTRALLGWCMGPTSAANLAVELLGWPWTLVGSHRFATCDHWVRTKIREVTVSRGEWVRLSRSWNRKMAVTARGSHCGLSPTLLLHDEGTAHFATTLLSREPGSLTRLLDQYLDLVPLPDQIVCVEASRQRCSKRLSNRRRGSAPDRHGPEHARFLQRAREVVDLLCVHPRIVPRLIRVQNETDDPMALDELAETVVRRLAGCGTRRLAA